MNINDKVFNLIGQLKNVQREYLIISLGVQWYMIRMYFKHKAWKHFSWKEWKNGLIMYCIDNIYTYEEAINSLVEEKIIE